MLRVYLDVCCFNRPFDDQSQDRIKFESEALGRILSRCQRGIWQLVSSGVVKYEIENCKDKDRVEKVLELESIASELIHLNDEIDKRSLELENMGFGILDALHLSYAEYGKIDIFFTTDDRLLKRYSKFREKINVRVINPILWFLEANDGEISGK